ncbi:hypothetical protein [Geothermobacter hydrogeniphilus]|nr:hypothetical protein [Geothermobacter hydrogeniphilus]
MFLDLCLNPRQRPWGKIYLLGGSDIGADSVKTNEEFTPGR